MPSEEFLTSDAGLVVIAAGVLLYLALILLPFALFGLKRRLDLQTALLEDIRDSLQQPPVLHHARLAEEDRSVLHLGAAQEDRPDRLPPIRADDRIG